MQLFGVTLSQRPFSALLLALSLVAAVPVASGSDVEMMQLTESNFTSTTSRGLWFIEFYSPQCSHCIKFAPTWEELVIAKTKQWGPYGFSMAQVNCIAQGDLCDANGVDAYPTMKLFHDGVDAQKFSGKRNFDTVSEFIDKHANELVRAPSPDHSASHSSTPNPDGRVAVLDPQTFKESVEGGSPMFVKFYAPWCGHCKKLAPTWIDLADKMKGVLNIAEVNCEEYKSLCKQEKVPGYPHLVFYHDHEKSEYRSQRSVASMQEWTTRAMSAGLSTVGRNDVEVLIQKEPVLFLYLHTFVTAHEEAESVRSAAKVLMGTPPIYKTQDPDVFSLLGIDPKKGSVVVAVKDHEPTPASVYSLSGTHSSAALSLWLVSEKLPTVGELTTQTYEDVMRNPTKPFIVLGALPKEAKSEQDALMRIAKTWRATGNKVQGRPVLFVWMDKDRWSSWLKSMYGIKVAHGPTLVISDHDKLRYYNKDSKSQPIRFDSDSILGALEAIDKGGLSWKNSENFMERMVRSLNNSIEAIGSWATHKPYTVAGMVLLVIVGMIYGIRKLVLYDSVPNGVYINGHSKEQRLD